MQKRKSRRCIQIWQMNLHSILQVDKKESLQCLKYENMFLKKNKFTEFFPFGHIQTRTEKIPEFENFVIEAVIKVINIMIHLRHDILSSVSKLPDKEMFSVKYHFPHWRLATQLPVTFVLLLDRSKQIGFFVISRSISFVLSYIGKDNKD